MTFDEYIDKYYLKMDIIRKHKIQFTLDDMEACWKASANNIATVVIDAYKGKFENLPHRPEDEQV